MSGPRTAPPPKRDIPAPKGVTSPAARFRREIEEALEAGAAPDDLVLHLTLSDANRLTRDPAIAVTDIAFKAGEMRFLGVKIQKGGVDASALERTER